MITNLKELIDNKEINPKFLDSKKQQTDYKIQYVSKYIEEWLRVCENRQNITRVVFVDCMCNAGIYKDGDLGTAMIVFQLFVEAAKRHQNIEFRILLNDIKRIRINICNKVIEKINTGKEIPKNVTYEIRGLDVNEYLNDYSYLDKNIAGMNTSAIMFIDPYNFHVIDFVNVISFSRRYYCEILFNLFTSDFIRNKNDEKIQRNINHEEVETIRELDNFIKTNIKGGHIKRCFSYGFNTNKNNELYRILFATPSDKGLEKLKDALWYVFNGKIKHTNMFKDQLPLWSEEEDSELWLKQYSREAKEKVTNYLYNESEVAYTDLVGFIMENTMLRKGQILKNVIKPLLEENRIEKCGYSARNNYKDDKYRVKR